ncbi:hypothetical protein BDZ89DRAFT_1125088 [Hymenopellis radicata]|nr:hypothetical protein BDZ89DRAFT_1125088 [Hymenopellis radicata]
MSRLTASPFVKPSPLDFGRRPLTPPETTVNEHAHSISVAGVPEQQRPSDAESVASALAQDPGARFRRVSSLAYHSSGLRDARERSAQKSFKSFIIVTPPPSFLNEYGPLGHTLSSGPSHRLSQGLLMPLFPTMYGQLTAIAKEYAFPNISGLCLYLHYYDSGITCTPRISDDTWNHLWGSMLDGSTGGNPKLPICGKIEFDIDLQQARWYSAWVASAQRNIIIDPAPPGRAHIRGESRGTFTTDARTTDDQSDLPSRPRHVPRKLSLVDRFDTASSITSRPLNNAQTVTPPENTPSRALSPIFQLDEPVSSKNELEFRVKSWRASAKLDPTPLGAMGQTSLEPANMPNDFELNDDFSTGEEPLRLEDFTWSISSRGPGSDILDSPVSCSRLPSVHIAARAAGSVCLTPSVATSFGPSDYTLSPLSASSFRLPTPDIAQRFYEDCPMTPTTATSWGPASVYSNEAWYDESDGGYSLDIAQRMIMSPPDTPCTATSWGPASWPASPLSEYRAPSIDLGERGVYSRPATPSTATSWGAPLSYPPSPTTPFYVSTPDVGQRSFDLDGPRSAPWPHVLPYGEAPTQSVEPAPAKPERRATVTGSPWAYVWPYTKYSISYPSLIIYPAVYPNFDLYPATSMAHSDVRSKSASREPVIIKCPTFYPNFDLYSPVYPYNLSMIYAPSYPPEDEINVQPSVGVHYPTFDLYPSVYPFVTPYPSVVCMKAMSTAVQRKQRTSASSHCSTSAPSQSGTVDVKVGVHYPTFELYPNVYPYVSPYPSVLSMRKEPSSVQHRTACYPDFELFTPIERMSISPVKERYATISCASGTAYPVFNLYPAVYPHFDLYPSVITMSSAKVSSSPRASMLISVHMPSRYPVLHLYPAVYPHFELYPSLPDDVLEKQETTAYYQSGLTCVYPAFNLYPAVYPFFDLYPAVLVSCSKHVEPVLSNALQYPLFNIYPAVYPEFDLYPSLGPVIAPLKSQEVGIVAKTVYPFLTISVYPECASSRPIIESLKRRDVGIVARTVYPFLTIYPAVYPDFDLYPSRGPIIEALKTRDVGIVARTVYPFLTIYPAVYPEFDLYPSRGPIIEALKTRDVGIVARTVYPFLIIYPAAYPEFDLYPSRGPIIEPFKTREVGVVTKTVYPYLTIYPAVYPHFDLWPAPSASNLESSQPRDIVMNGRAEAKPQLAKRPAKTHLQLHNEVFILGSSKNLKISTVTEPRVLVREKLPVPIREESPISIREKSPVSIRKESPVASREQSPEASRQNSPLSTREDSPVSTRGDSPVSIASHRESLRGGPPVGFRPARPRSRAGSVIGLPPGPPPTRSLPPVTGPPQRGLPRPPVSAEHGDPAHRFSTIESALPSRPDVHRTQSMSTRSYAYGRRELPRLPSVDETLSRSSSTILPAHAKVHAAELSRSNSGSMTSRPVRKRDSLVLQRVKAINSGIVGDERHSAHLDALDTFPAPPGQRAVRSLDHSRYPSK